MKKFKQISIVFISILFTTKIALSQQESIGFKFDFGKTIVTNSSCEDLFGIKKADKKDDNIQFEIMYDHKTEEAFHRVKIGLGYSNRNYSFGNDFKYFKIPICVDLVFGERIKSYLGAGIYGSYLFNYSSENSDFIKTQRDLQFGCIFNSGIEFSISELLNIEIGVKANYDLSYMYYVENSLSFDANILGEKYFFGNDKTIQIGLKYKVY